MSASHRLRPLREPRAGLGVEVDDGVLARLEHEVEVAAVDRLLRPPAIDDPPLLPNACDMLPVDPPRDPVAVRLNEGGARSVQSSRGTSNARASGMRDHG